MLSKTCKECGKVFTPRVDSNKLCSRSCFFVYLSKLFKGKKFSPNTCFKKGINVWNKGLKGHNAGAKNNMWKGGPIWKQCLICEKNINLRDYPLRDREKVKTCSRQCMTTFRQTEAYRKKMSDIARSKTFHISVETKALRNRLRRNFIYNLWRNKVLKRDNYICKICGIRGGNLCVDHYPNPYIKIFIEEKIKTYKQAVDCKKLWLVSAGRTLCLKCHYKTDTFGSKVHNML